MDARMEAAGKAEVALGRLPAFVGQMYPQLQSNARYQDLMRSLESTENMVADRRMKFNEAVSTYNEEARTVAGQVVCKATGLSVLSYYNPPGATQQALAIKGGGAGPSALTVATTPTGGSPVAVWRLQGTMRADSQWTAVVTAPDGKTHTARKGATLSTGTRVVDVLEDRVVLEEQGRNAAGQVVATRVVVTR
jgi:LemA protein